MSANYRHGHRSERQRRRRALVFGVMVLAMLGGVTAYIVNDIRRGQVEEVAGTSRVVTQVLGESSRTFIIDQPTYSFELPGTWKQTVVVNTPLENSITWQENKKSEENRTITVYIDKLPTKQAVNRLVPITIRSNQLDPGEVSDNCATFTQGGTQKVSEAVHKPVTPSKWQNVDFLCDLPRFIDNQVGAGVAGMPVNTITLKGSNKGSHNYYFLFIERNVQPRYTIFYDMLRSFHVK